MERGRGLPIQSDGIQLLGVHHLSTPSPPISQPSQSWKPSKHKQQPIELTFFRHKPIWIVIGIDDALPDDEIDQIVYQFSPPGSHKLTSLASRCFFNLFCSRRCWTSDKPSSAMRFSSWRRLSSHHNTGWSYCSLQRCAITSAKRHNFFVGKKLKQNRKHDDFQDEASDSWISDRNPLVRHPECDFNEKSHTTHGHSKNTSASEDNCSQTDSTFWISDAEWLRRVGDTRARYVWPLDLSRCLKRAYLRFALNSSTQIETTKTQTNAHFFFVVISVRRQCRGLQWLCIVNERGVYSCCLEMYFLLWQLMLWFFMQKHSRQLRIARSLQSRYHWLFSLMTGFSSIWCLQIYLSHGIELMDLLPTAD